jgi:hypothetical protein
MELIANVARRFLLLRGVREGYLDLISELRDAPMMTLDASYSYNDRRRSHRLWVFAQESDLTVSRSKHTDPKPIRAARRVVAPAEARGSHDPSRRRELGLAVEHLEFGAVLIRRADRPWPGPRIVTRRATPGFHHPALKGEILRLLEAVGPLAWYGLRSIELARRPQHAPRSALAFGRYQAPGRVILFEQPLSPWHLPGLLGGEDARRLECAGASVTRLPGGTATRVDWPEGTLQRFMLDEVLLHELGHHVAQHHKGKRPARTIRTQDHETLAARFAAEQRQALRAKEGAR